MIYVGNLGGLTGYDRKYIFESSTILLFPLTGNITITSSSDVPFVPAVCTSSNNPYLSNISGQLPTSGITLYPASKVNVKSTTNGLFEMFGLRQNDGSIYAYAMNDPISQSLPFRCPTQLIPYSDSGSYVINGPSGKLGLFIPTSIGITDWAIVKRSDGITVFNTTFKHLFRMEYDGDTYSGSVYILADGNYSIEYINEKYSTIGTVSNAEYLGEYYSISNETTFKNIGDPITISSLPEVESFELNYTKPAYAKESTKLIYGIKFKEQFDYNINFRFETDDPRISVSSSDFVQLYDVDSAGQVVVTAYPEGLGISKSVTVYYSIKGGAYTDGGQSIPSGGGGSFGKNPDGTPIVSDDVSVDVPNGSTIGKDSSTGMYTRYLMNTQYLELLGDWVYDPSLGLSLIITALENIYNKASDAMISLLSFPFSLTAPLTGITSIQQPLYFGHQPTGADFLALTSGSCTIDWGTLELYEYWGNFLDYAPHTKIEMFLPWGTGFVPIDPGQCLPGTLKVVTNIEFARGSCVHNIINQDGCVIGTYTGQPGSLVPLISSDIAAKRAAMVVGAVSLAVGGAVAAATPAIASMAAGSAYGSSLASGNLLSKTGSTLHGAARTSRQGMLIREASEAAHNAYSNVGGSLAPTRKMTNKVASDASIAAMRHHVEIARNGGFGDANAGMMIQYPYIIISRPEQNVPKDYGHYYGYPSNIYETLSNLTGYTEVAAIHLDGINATEPELDEIDNLLKGGVIL